MQTNTPSDRGVAILSEMGRIPVIIPGTLSPRHGPDGQVTGWKLQRWHVGRNETRYVPAGLVEKVRQGTAGYVRFRELADEFTELRGREALGEGETSVKKKPMKP